MRVDLSQFEGVEGSWLYLVILLLLAWTLAAFGEEIVYRGYLLNRFGDLLGRTKGRWLVAVALVSVCFGSSHVYQDMTGVLEAGIWAFVVGVIYIANARNLWLPIIFMAHTIQLESFLRFWACILDYSTLSLFVVNCYIMTIRTIYGHSQ